MINSETGNSGFYNKIFKIAGGVVITIIALILTTCSMTTVEVGHRGVQLRFNQVIGDPLSEGLYFVNPFTTHIVQMDTRVQKWESETEAYTRDVQQATIHFVVNYHLDPSQAGKMLKEVGTGWGELLVSQVIVEDIKREFGQHNAVDIIAQRDAAAREIETHITATLKNRDVIMNGFQLTNIDFTPEFEKAVEAKVVAQQAAIEEENRTVQIEWQAKQKVATAEGNAAATVLNAKADAESIMLRAKALEQNDKLVALTIAQKWDGKLPDTVLGDTIPLFNMAQKP